MKRASIALAIVGIGVCGLNPASASAADPTIALRTAENFGVLAGSRVSSTGLTVVTGDLGVSPGIASPVVGFPVGVVHGTTHGADATAAGDSATLSGRALSRSGTVTLAANAVSACPSPTADLSVNAIGSTPSVAPGADVTYAVTVTNGGAFDAAGATMTATLPSALSSADRTATVDTNVDAADPIVTPPPAVAARPLASSTSRRRFTVHLSRKAGAARGARVTKARLVDAKKPHAADPDGQPHRGRCRHAPHGDGPGDPAHHHQAALGQDRPPIPQLRDLLAGRRLRDGARLLPGEGGEATGAAGALSMPRGCLSAPAAPPAASGQRRIAQAMRQVLIT